MYMKFFLIFLLVFSTNQSLANNSQIANAKCDCLQNNLADIVAPLLPAVVNITVTQKAQSLSGGKFKLPESSPFHDFNELFERFGLPGLEDERGQDQKPLSAGSGFVIDPKGYIVTNHHVIANAEKIKVKFSNEKEIEASLVGSDPRTDLALLKINSDKDLAYVKFGNSDSLRPGDSVIAIGNPFGLGGTVTSGIVSATSRDINAGTLVDNFIQTDAAINQGNSGGPTFNIKGEVIGINTAIFSLSGGNVGIGFAVPSSFAAPIIEQIKNGGKVRRGWLGVVIQSTSEIAESMGLNEDEGAIVVSVAKDGPAANAGISAGDIILEFDGKKITNQTKLPRIVAETPVGKKVKIVLLTKGVKKNIMLSLTEMDSKASSSFMEKYYGESSDPYVTKELLDMELAEINSNIRERLQLDSNVEGILVSKIDKNSVSYKSGLRKGDIIVAVNQNNTSKIADLEKVLIAAKKSGKTSMMLMIARGNDKTLFVQLPIGKRG